ncbi:MAG TPA: prepilin-type N-terminal cleavage/methylation domain-containing protein [Fimbriimonas sp.]|nr:prepilin-type N-terminal cleavage/methylation domain-containing protein [Fimbriimonas sp.]
MKKAFTLIELLVVIAIIAILAAILFPVFAQAKLAAKKTQGLAQVKQIGTSMYIYVNDYDDVLPPYRNTDDLNGQPLNPTYLKLKAAGDPKAALFESDGQRSIPSIFINQMLDPYTKSNDIWRAPTYSNAWVGVQDKGTWDPGFFSYGGQNSYGVNNYVFKGSTTKFPASPYSTTSLAEPSNTLLIVDATYYNTLPAQPLGGFCKLGGYDPTNGNSSSSYMYYWKQLGNDALNFNSLGSPDPLDPSNAADLDRINARYSGVLNVVRGDTSAKAMQAKGLVMDLRDKGASSIWNPTKGGCE